MTNNTTAKTTSIFRRTATAGALAALLSGGVVASAGIADAAGPAKSGITAEAPTGDLPSASVARSALYKTAGTTDVSVVKVQRTAGSATLADTYAGAALVNGDRVTFYDYVKVNGSWTWREDQVLEHLPTVYDEDNSTLSITGGMVKGSADPVFIVKGAFTGDGTGQALAYHRNATSGWGVLTAQADRTIASSGTGISELGGYGLELNIFIQDGYLYTSSLWSRTSDAPLAEQTSNPVLRSWMGDSGAFRMLGETGGDSGGSQ
ncbi:hypothetical protein ACMYYO_13455 [Dermacoccaceae bacterium W4C1]